MPTYDYKCLKCGETFEAFQKISDKPLTKCPKCKGKVRRLISSGSGLIFKGRGFYATDYKKKESVPATKADNQKPCSGCHQSTCPNIEKNSDSNESNN